MILKLIMIGAILALLYRFAGGKFALPKREKKSTDRDRGNASESDALEECSVCGTYVTPADSIKLRGKLYCSQECISN
jgi:hypothetical protein